MQIQRMRNCVLLVTCVMVFGTASFVNGVPTAIIYYGNNASYAGNANDPTSLQGFTQLEDYWTGLGADVVMTDAFDPTGADVFFATAPMDVFTAAQAASLEAFLADGGLLVLSHNGGGDHTALNQLTSDLGSSLSFADDFRPVAAQIGTVVDDSHPLMAGLPNGSDLYTYAPGETIGGQALVDYPIGTHIVSVDSVGGGDILGVADFDMLNNVVGSGFPDTAEPNLHQFWANILNYGASEAVPDAGATLILLGCALFGLEGFRRKVRL